MENIPLNRVRPRLYEVAPLTYSICWGYAVINILLGAGLYLLYSPQVPIAVANIFSYRVWGILFAGLGFLGVYALIKNEWKVSKNILLAGLVIKAVWAIALIARSVVEPQSIVITLVWLFFAYIQAVTYIFFTPKINGDKNSGPAS